MFINVLGSGSAGNAIILSTGKSSILIDAGLSIKEIQKRINQLPFSVKKIDAIIISHEHNDHCQSWQGYAKLFDAHVYMTEATQHLIAASQKNFKVRNFIKSRAFLIEDLKIYPFPVPHDAVEPIALIIQHNNIKIGIAIDLGYLPKMVKNYLMECQVIILESNHDLYMLKNGPYPWHIKQRIMSRLGHLSNDDVGSFINECINENCLYLFLAHLSRKNNTPELALSTSLANLNNNKKTKILLTSQNEISDTIEI